MRDCGPECQETLREIGRFLDGELDVDLRSKVERHLGDCHPCMERAEFSRHLKAVIASKCGGEHVPAELLARIEELLRDRPGEHLV